MTTASLGFRKSHAERVQAVSADEGDAATGTSRRDGLVGVFATGKLEAGFHWFFNAMSVMSVASWLIFTSW